MATQTGWFCYTCRKQFPSENFPNWVEERVKLLDELCIDYKALFSKRKPSEHKRIQEMLDSIQEELCQIKTSQELGS